MKKGDIIEAKIEEIRFPNKGIMHAEDVEVTVKNALPGQLVRARVLKHRHGKAEGQLLEILERSPLEVPGNEIPCPKFGTCGGCTYLSLPYDQELTIKQCQVMELLQKALSSSPAAAGKPWENVFTWFEGIRSSPKIFGFRNKMEFTFGDEYKDGPLTLGMHRRGSFYDLADASDCVIVDEDYRKIIRTTISYFREMKIPFYHRLRHEGYLRHLLVRKASHTGEILVDLVTSTQTGSFSDRITEQSLLEEYTRRLLALEPEGSFAGILHTRNDNVADTVTDEGTEVLSGSDSFEETLLELRFKVTPFSFFQTNSYSAEVLYETAREWIQQAARESGTSLPVIFDLYCGTGTIAQLVSKTAKQVTGVEINAEAVAAARENAGRNGIRNCTFIEGDVLHVLDTIEQKPDLIVLDPPRDGIHPKALPKILAYEVPFILYISCKPTSLARDLPAFLEAGYRPVRGICVDQFVWSGNIETVCLLSNRKPDTKVRNDVDM